jgi:3',5'-cyclic AMP phosphodiesterase CpdA
MLIAQISDTHILAKSSDRPEAGPRAEDLRRCVADIGRLDPQPDVVIHTGDTVQTGAAADYGHLRQLLAPIEPSIYPTPGNRDDRKNFGEVFGIDGGPFLHYAVEDLPVRLIALDSIEPQQNKGALCTDRLRWLDDTLAAASARATVLFIHHPPFDLEFGYIDGYRNPADRDALAAVVRRHGQVRRLLCGHCHHASRIAWAGTEASTMASVARDVRKGVDEARFGGAPMYQLHTVAADGAVTTRTRLAAA